MTNAEASNAATVAEQGATVAPEKGSSKKVPPTKKGAPKGHKGAKQASPKNKAKAPSKRASKKASGTYQGGEKAAVIAMMQRKGGDTLHEITKASGWQNHTIRGFISILGSKHGMKIKSTRRESDKARVYEA